MSGDKSTPIEELIGWERMTWWGDYWWDGNRRRRRAEVDDLAGWLRERSGGAATDIECGFIDPPAGKTWLVTSYELEVSRWGSTVRDALEAAVRAVHEQEAS